jgi:sec-independent protein translocase protein TatB
VFGISFSELVLILIVALVVVGPQKLPRMLGTMGEYIGKLRRMASDMRRQTGIDELLRNEGLEGGLNELRNMMRQDFRAPAHPNRPDPYGDSVPYDRSREYPGEGCDAYGAIPEDLIDGSAGSVSVEDAAVPHQEVPPPTTTKATV